MVGLQNGYKLDVVFVIDATGSMGPIMDQVKARALTLGDEIKENLERTNRGVAAFRMRVIDFADFASEGKDAIHASEFYVMPDDRPRFESRIKNIQYESRGGDEPENALEALWVAMKSDWVDLPGLAKGRHIIVLITDAMPLNLGERNGCEGYVAEDYPCNVQEMEVIWNERCSQGGGITKLSPKNKRLLLFAPTGSDSAGHSWDAVGSWENTLHIEVNSGTGLADMNLDAVIAEIYRSV